MSRENITTFIKRKVDVEIPDEVKNVFCVVPTEDDDYGWNAAVSAMSGLVEYYVESGKNRSDIDVYNTAMVINHDIQPSLLKRIWTISRNIFIKSSTIDIVNTFNVLNSTSSVKRNIYVLTEDIQEVRNKYGSSIGYMESLISRDDTSIVIGGTSSDVEVNKSNFLPIGLKIISEKVYKAPIESLKNYEWFKWYKEPDDTVEVSKEHLDMFWYYMYERLRVYHNRVVLKNPYPWTDDTVLQEYRFTNISRDMDKMSIFEIENIIKKLDEPVDDLELRKKSVMANIMLYRTFVKTETYEAFGFIDLADKNWEDQWENGSKIILQRRENNIPNFSSSFMTNNLHGANSDPKTNWNKTYNGICMARYFFDNIDEIYDTCVNKCEGMHDQLEYLQTLPGVGLFTCYEFACSFAMAGRYCKNALVSWTQDNYTSAGPGSKKGLNAIFTNRGNLSYVDAIIYLRSIWDHEMKRLGYYEDFVSMLPEPLGGDIDLRVIEHCLCEFSKYVRCYYKSWKVKRRFRMETSDVDCLVLK